MKGKIGYGKILVKEIVPEEKTENGVIIPAVVREQRSGEVVIAGDGVEEIAVGSVLTFNTKKTKAISVNIDNERFLLMNGTGDYYIE